MFCALGCSSVKNLYRFPSRIYDKKRRKTWLDFFDIEEPNVDNIFACDRHFSKLQTTTKGIGNAAVPDISITYEGVIPPFRRKPKNWRKNVVVVTPRDPEFAIYRHETGVFPQNLFNISNTIQPVIQMPMIKSVSCSMSTQTNKRLCGLVEISDIKEEYRLNCFYCNEIFAIERWSTFVNHLKNNHFKEEEAFKMSKFLSQDHDYTSLRSPSTSPEKSSIKFNAINTFIQLPPPQPILLDSVVLPPLLAKPQKYTVTAPGRISSTTESLPPPLLPKPHQSNDKSFNITLADKLFKLLNETVLSPNFLNTEDDNILIIKNTGSNNLETSSFLTNLMNMETASTVPMGNTNSRNYAKSTSSSKYTRPIYTINHGLQDIPSTKHSLSRILLPPLPKNKMAKLVRKRIAQQTLKSINIFEKVYKTVKTRPPKVEEPENVHLNEMQISNLTPLSRCLKRTMTETTEAIPKKQKSTEIVFEFTPRDIIISLLENMQNFPVLWEFHDQPFNKYYNKAIEELCRLINEKWSLNITLLKMRRSINRILKFYRFMLPCESIDTFEDYYDKCAMFLPSSTHLIPHARCVYCGICYKKDTELRKHIKDRHKSLKWPHKCKECLERFRESDEYELHKRLPHYEEIFKCEKCDRRFNRRHLYNKHVNSHQRSVERRNKPVIQNIEITNISHECNVCNKHFNSLSDLKRHSVYHGEKKFKCHLCPKEFAIKTTLKLHLKRHRRELDFMCEVCGKGFIRKCMLENHMDTHTGAKITCNICNLKLRKCSLSRHLRLVHIAAEGTLESTFRAQSYRFKRFMYPNKTFENQLGRKRRELGPRKYKCKLCDIHFVNLKQLKDHNKLAHADAKRIPCKICSFGFLHTNNLKRHYRNKHKLHMYQVFKLVDCNEDLNSVLAITDKELESMNGAECIAYSLINHNKVSKLNLQQDDDYLEQGRMYSDNIQEEIMKAVENLDKQEIKVDDDDFFKDLLKHS